MPINNLGNIHISDSDFNLLNNNLENILKVISAFTVNLSASERQKFGRVNEKNKLLINKINDYHLDTPNLQSPEVDWEEFDKDYLDRKRLEGFLSKLKSIEYQLTSIKILHDYDNYSDSLIDYEYAKYKNRTSNSAGFENKINDLKGFFPNTGKTKKSKKIDDNLAKENL